LLSYRARRRLKNTAGVKLFEREFDGGKIADLRVVGQFEKSERKVGIHHRGHKREHGGLNVL
jgi:hypothetical protein